MRLKKFFTGLIGLGLVLSSFTANKVNPLVHNHNYATDIDDDGGVLTYFDVGDRVYWSGSTSETKTYSVSDMYEDETVYLCISMSNFTFTRDDAGNAVVFTNDHASKFTVQIEVGGTCSITANRQAAFYLEGSKPIEVIFYGGTSGGTLTLGDANDTYKGFDYGGGGSRSDKTVKIYKTGVDNNPDETEAETFWTENNHSVTFDANDYGSHVHMWDYSEIATEATCETGGQITYSCSHVDCSETKSVDTEPLGHEWYTDSTTPATCIAKGSKEVHCVRNDTCSATATLEIEIDPSNHVGYDTRYQEYTASTCQTQGSCIREKYCTGCDAVIEVYARETLELGDHDWDTGEVTTPATCISKGVRTFHCKTEGCTETYTEDIDIDSDAHSETKVRNVNVRPGNCQTVELFDRETYCPDCGVVVEKETDVENGLGDHDWEGTITKAATCIEKGLWEYTCTVEGCGETYTEDIDIDSTNHTNIKQRNINVVNATCLTEGSYCVETYCADCDTSISIAEPTVVPATGHAWDTGEITTPATCQSAGVRTHHCTNDDCEETSTSVVAIDPNNHVNTATRKVNIVNATCTTAGSYDLETYCVDCGEVINTDFNQTINATGHEWDEGEITTTATCVTDGIKTQHCQHDDCEETNEINLGKDANNHVNKSTREVNVVAATCTTAGSYDLETYCVDCGAIISTQTGIEIAPTGHNWDEGTITKKATCAETGTITHHCLDENCNETYDEIIPIDPNAHDMEKEHWVLKGFTPPTDKVEGYSGDYHCPLCDAVMEEGHILEKLSVDDPFEDVDDVEDIITDEVEVTEETKENLEDLIENDPDTASDILDSVNDSGESLKEEYENGDITEEEYEEQKEILQTILDTSAQIANDRSVAVANVEPLQNDIDNCNLEGALNIQDTIDNFYYNTLYDMLSKERNNNNSDSNKVHRKNAKTLDLQTDAETYRNALNFIEYSVEKMCDFCTRLRECSNESFVEHINESVAGISYRSFRNFDKDAADQEFLADAKEAVLIYMQGQTLNSLKKAYEEQQKSYDYKGTYKTQIDLQYQQEVAKVSDLVEFNGVVLDVTRMKFISVVEHRLTLDNSYQEKANELLSLANNVETFTPVYDEIFASWALNTELKEEYDGITLEVLTSEVITEVTGQSSNIQRRKGLGSEEVTVFIAIFAPMASLLLGYLIYNVIKERRLKK